jgi:hypothetical protein
MTKYLFYGYWKRGGCDLLSYRHAKQCMYFPNINSLNENAGKDVSQMRLGVTDESKK